MPLQYFDKISSTNEFIKENLTHFKNNFSGIYTFNQIQGKGQRGTSWLCEPNKNIALTFCLTNSLIPPISISFWVAISIRTFIEKLIQIPTFIKWPNDILVNEKKICGILIEKSNGTYIIGIGINVLQTSFPKLSRASSISLLTSKSYSLNSLVENLILYFTKNYNLLDNLEYLHNNYNKYLFRKKTSMSFIINGSVITGIIKNVDKEGLLNIELENNLVKKFNLKEIEFLY